MNLPSTQAPEVPIPRPTAATERLAVIDVLRGVALLGILTMNITLGQPGATRLNPLISGGFEGANFAMWVAGYFLFDEKMITLFSMLFGAGVVLFCRRLDRQGVSAARLFYRRSGILLLIGLVHAYGLWEGDILVTYAICGMLIYPLRRKPARTLAVAGVLVWLVSVPLTVGFGIALRELRNNHSEQSAELAKAFQPDAAEARKEIERVRRSGYLALAAARAPEALQVQTRLLFLSLLWTVSGRMLLGMALFKAGFMAGTKARGFYRKTAWLGYGAGWPLVAFACVGLIRHSFDPAYLFGIAFPVNSAGSILVGIGHASVVILLCQSGWVQGWMRRLQAVGRMALTNYLAQTLITTTLFYGYGFGLFGAFSRVQLYLIVFAIWGLQLWYSPLWLSRFRFGPAEWLWRSITYGQAQKLVLRPVGALPQAVGPADAA